MLYLKVYMIFHIHKYPSLKNTIKSGAKNIFKKTIKLKEDISFPISDATIYINFI